MSKRLKQFFSMLDKDRSGTVNAKEFSELLADAGITEVSQFEIRVVIYMAGGGETGEISFAQFAAFDAKTKEDDFDPEEVLRAVFRSADKDGSGSLSKDEIRQAMIKESHLLTEDEFQELTEQIRWTEGDINWEEFLATMKSKLSSMFLNKWVDNIKIAKQ